MIKNQGNREREREREGIMQDDFCLEHVEQMLLSNLMQAGRNPPATPADGTYLHEAVVDNQSPIDRAPVYPHFF